MPDLAKRGRGTLSFYRIELPHENLPQPVLALETSEQVFRRSIELGVQREPDRRHKGEWFESLERTTWQHAVPGSPAPPLEIQFPRLNRRELLLIVDEGDNRPLPISRARLRLPDWQLLFFRPASPLRLLYGRTDLAEPRYDVALLSPSVMGGRAREIVAAPEVALSSARGARRAADLLDWAVGSRGGPARADRAAYFVRDCAATFATWSMTRSRFPLQIFPICCSV